MAEPLSGALGGSLATEEAGLAGFSGAVNVADASGVSVGSKIRMLFRRLPWWVHVTLIFAGGRLVSTLLLLFLASREGSNPWTAAHPGYFDFADIWDGRWYETIAFTGYPHELPYYEGQVGNNQWAFLPVYPYVVAGIMAATGLNWSVAAVDVSVVFALAATLLFYQLMRRVMRPSEALFATVLFSVAPTSALFQVAYAESIYTFLLVLIMYLLLRRRYWTMMPIIVIAAFTRPGGLAIALMLGLHVAWRLWARVRDNAARAAPRVVASTRPEWLAGALRWSLRSLWRVLGRVQDNAEFRTSQIAASIMATALALASGVAWPLIASAVTGVPGAYTLTELSWRTPYSQSGTHLTPFASWFQGGAWWFTVWFHLPAWLGWAAVVVVVSGFAVLLFTPAVRGLGRDVVLWLASYGAYIFAVWFPQSSTFRVLMPMFPLAGAAVKPRNAYWRTALVLACIAGQLGWLTLCWIIGPNDWSPP